MIQPLNYITYLDANNLYGWAMSEDLPTGDFKWVSEKVIDLTKKRKKDSFLKLIWTILNIFMINTTTIH